MTTGLDAVAQWYCAEWPFFCDVRKTLDFGSHRNDERVLRWNRKQWTPLGLA